MWPLREGVVAPLSPGCTTTSWKVFSSLLGAHVTPGMSAGCPGSFSKLCLGSADGSEAEGIPGEALLGMLCPQEPSPTEPQGDLLDYPTGTGVGARLGRGSVTCLFSSGVSTPMSLSRGSRRKALKAEWLG